MPVVVIGVVALIMRLSGSHRAQYINGSRSHSDGDEDSDSEGLGDRDMNTANDNDNEE